MPSDELDEDEQLRVELAESLGTGRFSVLRHRQQRNDTWLFDGVHGRAVVKRYRCLTADGVAGVLQAEACARTAGIVVPEVLYRSSNGRVVAYAHVTGEHRVQLGREEVELCGELFTRQLYVLAGFHPDWTAPRPPMLPRRAQEAVCGGTDEHLAVAITELWEQLARLARERPSTASHTGWRADNILFTGTRAAAVLDWEDVVLLPAAEAIGYAAASLTHSWRETLYQPLELDPVENFLHVVRTFIGWRSDSPEMNHARAAAFFTCAVRVAEDQRRGAAKVSLDELRSAFGRIG